MIRETRVAGRQKYLAVSCLYRLLQIFAVPVQTEKKNIIRLSLLIYA